MYPQFPGRGESCIRPALVPQGRSQGSPLHKGHRQLQTALSLSPSLHFPIFPFRPVRTSVLSRRRLPPEPLCKLPPYPLQEGAPEVDQDTLLDLVELHLSFLPALDCGQADVQHAAVFVLAHGFQLFTTGHTHGQALRVGEKIPHLLAWGGKSLGTREFHRRSFARSTARSAV